MYIKHLLSHVAPVLSEGQVHVKDGFCPAAAGVQVPPFIHGLGSVQGSTFAGINHLIV